jgi:hypothetical protein
MATGWSLRPEWIWQRTEHSLLVEHSSAPFLSEPTAQIDNADVFFAAALEYLARLVASTADLRRLDRIREDLARDLAGQAPLSRSWRWLRFGGSPRASSRLDRETGAPGAAARASSLTLLATDEVDEQQDALGGLSIAALVESSGGLPQIAILGCRLHLHPRTPSERAAPEPALRALGRASSVVLEWPWERLRAHMPRVMAQDPVTRFGVCFRDQDFPTSTQALDNALVPDSLGFSTHQQQIPLGQPGQFLIHVPGELEEEPPLAEVPFDMFELKSDDWPVWAASAHFHASAIFGRLAADGFPLQALLPYIELPLHLYTKALVLGHNHNARVAWLGDLESLSTPQSNSPAPMAIVFAIEQSGRISICCDARWFWHEFGHVLIAGATGHMELPFCHSVGDALAAISQDCDSQIESEARGETFPWISTDIDGPHGSEARRHDLRPDKGFGWYGDEYGVDPLDPGGFRSYLREQIMSSTLFTLYLALGGAQHGARDAVRDAASLVIALIVRAVWGLGVRDLSPAKTVVDFFLAVVFADRSLGPYRCRATQTWRAPGMAVKVIRWAFEQHGLWRSRRSPPAPLRPDLYIDDGRSGGYDPLDDLGPFSSRWHASEDALALTALNGTAGERVLRVACVVRNCGSAAPVGSVSCAGWWADITALPAPPPWPGSSWQSVAMHTEDRGDGTYAASAEIALPAGRSYGVLVAADCDDDLSNPSALSLESITAPPLSYLVAQDNNLGYRPIAL